MPCRIIRPRITNRILSFCEKDPPTCIPIVSVFRSSCRMIRSLTVCLVVTVFTALLLIKNSSTSSECLDWTARQAPPELRRCVSNWGQLTPGKLFICTLQSLVPTTLDCHDEARRRPTCGRWSSLPSLGSKIAHAAGSCCRRSLCDRTCPPPVVHTFRAPRRLLLRGDQSHKGMTKV